MEDLLRSAAAGMLFGLTMFGLGAAVMWSLESKRPRMQPMWLGAFAVGAGLVALALEDRAIRSGRYPA